LGAVTSERWGAAMALSVVGDTERAQVRERMSAARPAIYDAVSERSVCRSHDRASSAPHDMRIARPIINVESMILGSRRTTSE
jgi:hypothetical protein